MTTIQLAFLAAAQAVQDETAPFMTTKQIVSVAVAAGLSLMTIAIYNNLVRIRNEVRNGWNQIDVQLKRRHDLIPNLVETVKGYATHEQQTLENVAKARNLAQQAQGRVGQIAAEGALGAALANLFAIAENYPDLKANKSFQDLSEEINSTENRIAFSRQYYNDTVMEYNNTRQVFPTVLVARLLNFAEEPYWKLTDEEDRKAPKVSFQR